MKENEKYVKELEDKYGLNENSRYNSYEEDTNENLFYPNFKGFLGNKR